jgi:hypothetical protein
MIRPALPRFTRLSGGSRWAFVTGGIVYFGSDDHHLHALHLATGVERWKFKAGGRIPSTPAIADGVLFFLSYDANFDAVDAANGALKMEISDRPRTPLLSKTSSRHRTSRRNNADRFDFYLSSPIVSVVLCISARATEMCTRLKPQREP